MSDEAPKKGKFKGGDPVAIGKLGGRSKGSTKAKLIADALSGLSPRQSAYVQNRASGMTKEKAKVAAGYSPLSLSAKIENEDVQQAFRRLAQIKLNPDKILKRVDEGMDAKRVIFSTQDGKITDLRNIPDHAERRKAAQLAAEMSGVWNPKEEIAVTKSLDEHTAQALLPIHEKLQIESLSPERIADLRKSHVPIVIDAETMPEETIPQDQKQT